MLIIILFCSAVYVKREREKESRSGKTNKQKTSKYTGEKKKKNILIRFRMVKRAWMLSDYNRIMCHKYSCVVDGFVLLNVQ